MYICLPGKWHLGLNCNHSDDHCHHPTSHGFNYFFGIPLTHLRDCQPGHGTIFHLHKYLPYRTIALVLVTAAFLHYVGIVTIRRRLVLGLLMVVIGAVVGLIVTFPYMNCLLIRNHQVVEQPYAAENLTQRMTEEAVDFMERCVSVVAV